MSQNGSGAGAGAGAGAGGGAGAGDGAEAGGGAGGGAEGGNDPIVIAAWTNKGGVAKTTTVENVALEIMRETNESVLIFDMDSQGDATHTFTHQYRMKAYPINNVGNPDYNAIGHTELVQNMFANAGECDRPAGQKKHTGNYYTWAGRFVRFADTLDEALGPVLCIEVAHRDQHGNPVLEVRNPHVSVHGANNPDDPHQRNQFADRSAASWQGLCGSGACLKQLPPSCFHYAR